MEYSNETRIVLFGSTGSGKSSLANTLAGKNHFRDSAAALSVTQECATAHIKLESGKTLKIVDTPGIIDSKGKSMLNEVKRFFDFLDPGPHAIILVLTPTRFTEQDEKVLKDLNDFFGDDRFLDQTIIVMVRKNDIIGKLGESNNITEFIQNNAAEKVKQIYKDCGKRIVAVENKQDWPDRHEDAKEVLKKVDKLDGYYDHKYFSRVHQLNEMISENKKKEAKIKELEKKNKELEGSTCKLL